MKNKCDELKKFKVQLIDIGRDDINQEYEQEAESLNEIANLVYIKVKRFLFSSQVTLESVIEEKELYLQKWAEAKENNEMTLYRKYSEHCDGTVKECDIDNVEEYVATDGSIWENRVHCF